MDRFIKKITPYNVTDPNNLSVLYCKGQFLTVNNQALFSLENILTLTNQVQHYIISIGCWNNHPIYLIILLESPVIPSNMSWQALRPIMLTVDMTSFKMLGYALQIAIWFENNQFCGRCGHSMQYISAQEFRMDCPHCQYMVYPRLNPSMIILVTRGDKILLAHSHRFSNTMYSTLAGFVEPGESVEQCAHREVWEEVQLTIKNLHYIGSQNWPYPNALMLGFHAEYETGEITPQADEIADAQWFSVYDLPTLPPKQAISRYLIDLYVSQYLGNSKPALPN